MTGLFIDLRYAWRELFRRPGLTAAMVATLTLGIGATTAAFSLVNAFFLKPLPYRAPQELLFVWETEQDSEEPTTVAPANYLDWRGQADAFSALAAFNIDYPTVTGSGYPERLLGAVASPELFEVLGAEAARGRVFTADDAGAGADPVVVLSDAYWRSRFGGDPGVVGSTIRVDDRAHTVIGVMPAGFRQPETGTVRGPTALWRPLLLHDLAHVRTSRYLRVLGRLGPGRTVEEARRQMEAIAGRMREAYPEADRGRGVVVTELDDVLLAQGRRPLLLVLLGVGLVLLVVCANVAHLTLARSQERAREVQVRAALGCGRWRLVRHFLVEALLVSLLGGSLGLLLVACVESPIRLIEQEYFPSVADPAVDWRVALFTLLVSGTVALGFGLLPALRSTRPSGSMALGTGGAVPGPEASRTRSALVAVEVALTVTLLIAAGVLGRSLLELVAVEPGFSPQGVLVFETWLAPPEYRQDPAAPARFYAEVERRLDALPGVIAVSPVSDLPFTRWDSSTEVSTLDGEPRLVEFRNVGSDYFRMMEIPLAAGRQFDRFDRADSLPVAIVNRRLAEELWPGGSPVGEELLVGGDDHPDRVTVVGMVENVLDDGFDGPREPLFYLPYRQSSWIFSAFGVRTDSDPMTLVPAVREAVAQVDPRIAVNEVGTLDRLLRAKTARPRAASVLAGLSALLALALATAGIYGVVAYQVGQRTRELGVRAALGAKARDLVGMTVASAVRAVCAGVVLGIGGSLVTSRLLASLLFGVRPWDPLTLATVTVLLLAVALVASFLPARRAARVDPVVALRGE